MADRAPINPEEIKAKFDTLDREAKERLRKAIDADQGLWSKICAGKKQIGAGMAVLLDRISKGTLPVRLMRADIFGGLIIKEEVVPKSYVGRSQ